MSFFSVTIKGIEQIDRDYSQEVSDIATRAIPYALRQVGAEMVVNLQKHINDDWYKPWGAPLVYKRRTDDPSLGTPLGDRSNMDYHTSGNTLVFSYLPRGEHQNAKFHTKDGDELIRTLQDNRNWTYPPSRDTRGRSIMPRPFWNNFVEEQMNGKIVQSFRTAITTQGYKFQSDRGLDIYADGSEKL